MPIQGGNESEYIDRGSTIEDAGVNLRVKLMRCDRWHLLNAGDITHARLSLHMKMRSFEVVGYIRHDSVYFISTWAPASCASTHTPGNVEFAILTA